MIYLAPMEGVTDPILRAVLCRHGGYDWCFSEFIRIPEEHLPDRTFLRLVPELNNGGCTADGTPVRVQLLGDNPQLLADSAVQAVRLGARGIDLNFGCPSRFVHHSGSMLLREPDLIHEITRTVADRLQGEVILSVKMRSGFADKSELGTLAAAVAVPGVTELTVHCRTRRELYRTEALDWTVLKPLHEQYPELTIIANGDIVDAESARICREQSGCDSIMVGRGALGIPNLGHVIRDGSSPMGFSAVLAVAAEFGQQLEEKGTAKRSIMDRLKQFLGYARRGHPEVGEFFRGFCRIEDLSQAYTLLAGGEEAVRHPSIAPSRELNGGTACN